MKEWLPHVFTTVLKHDASKLLDIVTYTAALTKPTHLPLLVQSAFLFPSIMASTKDSRTKHSTLKGVAFINLCLVLYLFSLVFESSGYWQKHFSSLWVDPFDSNVAKSPLPTAECVDCCVCVQAFMSLLFHRSRLSADGAYYCAVSCVTPIRHGDKESKCIAGSETCKWKRFHHRLLGWFSLTIFIT